MTTPKPLRLWPGVIAVVLLWLVRFGAKVVVPGFAGFASNALKPYFNDFVVHKDHACGFDGRILACIDLGDGQRKWKGGPYGNGQLVLLPDQDLLLVLSDEGELALARATPDQFTELARFPALEGKLGQIKVSALPEV